MVACSLCQDRQEFLTRWKKKQEFVAVNLYFDIEDGRLKLYKNKIHLEIYNFLQNQIETLNAISRGLEIF